MEKNERKLLTMKKISSVTAKVKKCAASMFHFIRQERQDYLITPHGARFLCAVGKH